MTTRPVPTWTRAVTWGLGLLAAIGVARVALWVYRVYWPPPGAPLDVESPFLGILAGGVFLAWLLWLHSPTPARLARFSQELGVRLERRPRLGFKDAMLGYVTGYEGEYRGSRVRLNMGGPRRSPTRFRLYHGRPLEFDLHCHFNMSWFDPAGEVRLAGPTIDVGDPTLRCTASDWGRAGALLRTERVRDAHTALKAALAGFDSQAGFVLGHEAVTVFSYYEPPGKAVVDAMRELSAACDPVPPRPSRARAG